METIYHGSENSFFDVLNLKKSEAIYQASEQPGQHSALPLVQ